jgi:hypothetical protein
MRSAHDGAGFVAVVDGAVVVVRLVVVRLDVLGSGVGDVEDVAEAVRLVAAVEGAAVVGSPCEQPAPTTARTAATTGGRRRGLWRRREVIRPNVASGTIEP